MDFIPELDNALSVDDKVKLLEQAQQHLRKEAETNSDPLSEQDVRLLQGYASDGSPATRGVAIEILLHYGQAEWDDIRRWMLDPDEDVRSSACGDIPLFYGHAEVSFCNKQCFVQLFAEAARTYGHMSTETWWLVEQDSEWLDLFWTSLGELLNLGNADLSLNLTCGLLEHIIGRELIKFNDPRLQSWIEGDSTKRKMALLDVVQWRGVTRPLLGKIAQALAQDGAESVSSAAKGLLAGELLPKSMVSWHPDEEDA
jgi:hypothetical protein